MGIPSVFPRGFPMVSTWKPRRRGTGWSSPLRGRPDRRPRPRPRRCCRTSELGSSPRFFAVVWMVNMPEFKKMIIIIIIIIIIITWWNFSIYFAHAFVHGTFTLQWDVRHYHLLIGMAIQLHLKIILTHGIPLFGSHVELIIHLLVST